MGLALFRAELETLPPDARGRRALGRALEADPWQREMLAIFDAPQTRVAFIDMPRGGGKSERAAGIAVERVALRCNHTVIVWAHDLDQTKHIVAAAHAIVRRDPVLSAAIEILKTGLRCEATGSEMIAVPADSPGSHGYGGKEGGVTILCDEVATWPNRDLLDVILSTVAKHPKSQALMFSNAGSVGNAPWDIREICRTSTDPAIRFFTLDYSKTLPSWLSRTEIERQRKLLTAREFARLWEGSWQSGESLAFPWEDIEACLVDVAPRRMGDVLIGVDYGKLHDFSAGVVIDVPTWGVVEVRRRRKMDYGAWNREVAALAKSLDFPAIVADATGVGQAALDGLCALLPGYSRFDQTALDHSGNAPTLGRVVYGVTLTSQWKLEAVRKLQLDVEKHRLRISRSETELITELREFQETLTTTGLPKFGNPPGPDRHDDLVVGLMLANFLVTESARSESDRVLRKLKSLSFSAWAKSTHPLIGGGGDPHDHFLQNLRDAAVLRRKFELGLFSKEEYDSLAAAELPWGGWGQVWAEHGLRGVVSA